jgi:SAM-dependent methyltransferase
MPDAKLLSEYNSSFFEFHGIAVMQVTTLAFFSAIAKLRLSFLKKYLNSRKSVIDTVFELGPGPGFFAKAWLAQYQSKYMAYETDDTCYAGLKELGVQLVDEFSIERDNTIVDLVVMSHVLEHVTSPKSFIKDATRGMRKGGVLFVEVPCKDYQYKPIDEPHLLFFDKKSMHHLLTEAGFVDVELGYFGEEVDKLPASFVKTIWMALRSKLIGFGLVWPFAIQLGALGSLLTPLEFAAVVPFKAHIESNKPARWLRAVAQKA